VLRSGFYYPNIHIAWKPPEIDSVPVRYYRVLELGPDTAFSIVSLNIPGRLTDYYQKLDKADFPPVTSLDVRIFKVIAIDSLARAGDSSESCTLYIAPQVYKDTMTNDGCLSWVMQAQMGQMQTWASVWNMNHDIIWTGDITEEFAAELHGFNIRSCMTAVPADTGMYFYGIRFVLNLSHVSLKIGSFNVP